MVKYKFVGLASASMLGKDHFPVMSKDAFFVKVSNTDSESFQYKQDRFTTCFKTCGTG